MEKWQTGLLAWKDYNIEYAEFTGQRNPLNTPVSKRTVNDDRNMLSQIQVIHLVVCKYYK